MLARYLRQAPLRYALQVPQHPLALWTRFALTRPELALVRQYTTPTAPEGRKMSPNLVESLHPLFQAVAGGEHPLFSRLIYSLMHAGLTGGTDIHHWAEQYLRHTRSLNDPTTMLQDAFTPGHFINEAADEHTRDFLDTLRGGLFRPFKQMGVPAHDMRMLTPLLQRAHTTGGLQHLLDLHQAVFQLLHPHGHQLVEDATRHINQALGHGVGQRIVGAREVAEGVRSTQQVREDRPMESVPEDYYAHG